MAGGANHLHAGAMRTQGTQGSRVKRRRASSDAEGAPVSSGSGLPEAGPRPDAGGAAFLLAQVGAHAAARFGERLSSLGLAPAHAGILRLLRGSPGMSQQALARRLAIFPSRLVALLDELAERGLIERRDNPDDRRVYSLYLTALGQQRLHEIGRIARDHQDELVAALSAPEREQLASLLRRIADQQGLTPLVHPGYRGRHG
jgi:DNA-binding MarR family transcriptional regulator